MKSRIFAVFIVLVLSFPTYHGQDKPQDKPKDNDPVIKLGTKEVTLDVIVRDKNGKVVKDLTANDFKIFEDGVRQDIESFRTVIRDAQSKDKVSDPALLAFVFDRLTPEARGLVRKAAMQYSIEGLQSRDFAGIYSIDQSLRTIQSFTNNHPLVKQAIDRATTTSTSTVASNEEGLRVLAERDQAASAQVSNAAAQASQGGGDAGVAIGAAAMQQALAQMQMRMMEGYELLQRDNQGQATVNALLALMASMQNIQGRKTIIFFSEGVSLPVAIAEKFNSLVHSANKAGVSVYTIDAAGLRTDNPITDTSKEMAAQAQKRMNQVHSGRDPSGPLMRDLETNEYLLRKNPHSGLANLADGTGGFLIKNTNDIADGLRKIDEDMRSYYVLTYSPKNQEMDGKFRKISIKASHSGIDIQTRKGYYAIDSPPSMPLLDYEISAIASLSKNGTDNTFKLKSGAFYLPFHDRTGLTSVIAEIPSSTFTHAIDNDKKSYNTNFSIVVLIKDQSNKIVGKLSRQYLLSGPANDVNKVKQGNILFYRETSLSPGNYNVTTIMYDALADKSSVQQSTLDVSSAEGGDKLLVGSPFLIKRAEQLTEEEKKSKHPLHYKGILFYPNIGETVRKSEMKQLVFYFKVISLKGGGEKLMTILELFKDGHVIESGPINLPPTDQNGEIIYVLAWPTDKITPGKYKMKIMIGGQSRETWFTVE